MNALYWLIAGLLLAVLEIITPGFVIIWFGVAAIIVAFLAYLGLDSMTLQAVIFCVISLALTLMSRTIFKKYFIKNSPGNTVTSSIERLIGSAGVVTETINNDISTGRVLVNSQDWAARSVNNAIFDTGTKVQVIDIDGIKLLVKLENTTD